MARLRSAQVIRLFDQVDHSVTFRDKWPTVVTGPNGTGKTHLLRLIHAAINGNAEGMFQMPFAELRLTFDDRVLRIVRSKRPDVLNVADEGSYLTWSVERPHQSTVRVRVTWEEYDTRRREASSQEAERVPPWIVRLATGEYYDRRMERVLPSRTVERRYGISEQETLLQRTPEGKAFLTSLSDLNCVLVDTKRLDMAVEPRIRKGSYREHPTASESRIMHYIHEIQAQVTTARNESLNRTQAADLKFATRALDAATLTVRISELNSRYETVSRLYEEMARNGLAPDEKPMSLPSKPNPTARRILYLLLQDWAERLEPLVPINDKLNGLRSILDSKLRNSGKITQMTSGGRLGIASLNGSRKISVSRLSSGEQHLLAIFSQLLFATKPGSLVLIDEPEISMHLSWQHSFLSDVLKVSEAAELQVVVATHSTGIVNGRWDLEESLELPSIDLVTGDNWPDSSSAGGLAADEDEGEEYD